MDAHGLQFEFHPQGKLLSPSKLLPCTYLNTYILHCEFDRREALGAFTYGKGLQTLAMLLQGTSRCVAVASIFT